MVAGDLRRDRRALGGVSEFRGMLRHNDGPLLIRQLGLAGTIAKLNGQGDILTNRVVVHPQAAGDPAQWAACLLVEENLGDVAHGKAPSDHGSTR